MFDKYDPDYTESLRLRQTHEPKGKQARQQDDRHTTATTPRKGPTREERASLSAALGELHAGGEAVLIEPLTHFLDV
jgi:hypothetical protein